MMQKQMIMEQYRNNKTFKITDFFSVSTKVQIKLDASAQAQQTDEVAYVFSKCLNNYILFTNNNCYTSDLSCIGSSNSTYTVVSKSIHHNSWVKQDTKLF